MPEPQAFHLKRFSLMHDRSTMKVGTDAMLLASWVVTEGVSRVLEIGSGCGIISLILAQRSKAEIDAIDIDEASVEEATINFRFSPWSERLHCYHTDLRQFTTDYSYDLIISNPPFFTSTFKTQKPRRNLARHEDSLPFPELIDSAKTLLNQKGRFALVLPDLEAEKFIPLAESNGLFLHKILNIIPVEGKTPNRLNMVFNQNKIDKPIIENFTIRNGDQQFTEQYKIMLKDFYLGL
ncbi:MAG: tRNA1(Val) (adenine(37)-N6)-methyltransferase [Bacteroidales bacterium]